MTAPHARSIVCTPECPHSGPSSVSAASRPAVPARAAVSLGHDETLIVHVGPDARGGSENYPASFHKYGHLRLSIGLEDPEDIIDDILSALDKTFGDK